MPDDVTISQLAEAYQRRFINAVNSAEKTLELRKWAVQQANGDVKAAAEILAFLLDTPTSLD